MFEVGVLEIFKIMLLKKGGVFGGFLVLLGKWFGGDFMFFLWF